MDQPAVPPPKVLVVTDEKPKPEKRRPGGFPFYVSAFHYKNDILKLSFYSLAGVNATWTVGVTNKHRASMNYDYFLYRSAKD